MLFDREHRGFSCWTIDFCVDYYSKKEGSMDLTIYLSNLLLDFIF